MTRDERIRQLVDRTNMTIEDATFAVDYSDGTTEGDVKAGSPERRRRLGLDGVMATDEELDRVRGAVPSR